MADAEPARTPGEAMDGPEAGRRRLARRLAVPALLAAVALLALLALHFPRTIEPFYKWIPQPLQDRLWHATPLAASVILLGVLVIAIGAYQRDLGGTALSKRHNDEFS